MKKDKETKRERKKREEERECKREREKKECKRERQRESFANPFRCLGRKYYVILDPTQNNNFLPEIVGLLSFWLK